MRIRPEEPLDVPSIRTVNVTAFGSAAEADIVDALRAAADNVISLVAEDDGEIVGHIMFSPVQVVGSPDLRAMALAPMAIVPERQRSGIGTTLARAGLEHCRRLRIAPSSSSGTLCITLGSVSQLDLRRIQVRIRGARRSVHGRRTDSRRVGRAIRNRSLP